MLALDKPLGPTSYQALCALRELVPSLHGAKLGHAGRLDPLAEGLLVALVGDENKRSRDLRAQPKTYEVDVLFGISTDSCDSLGLVTALRDEVSLAPAALDEALARFTGTFAQRCPPFSQARVGGRSLIGWGHAGVEVERPLIERTITSIARGRLWRSDLGALCDEAARRVGLVRGDFRQAAIAARWRELSRRDVSLPLATLTVDCSAGTYMRALAADLGGVLGVPAMAWRIRRTRAGAVTLDGALVLP